MFNCSCCNTGSSSVILLTTWISSFSVTMLTNTSLPFFCKQTASVCHAFWQNRHRQLMNQQGFPEWSVLPHHRHIPLGNGHDDLWVPISPDDTFVWSVFRSCVVMEVLDLCIILATFAVSLVSIATSTALHHYPSWTKPSKQPHCQLNKWKVCAWLHLEDPLSTNNHRLWHLDVSLLPAPKECH